MLGRFGFLSTDGLNDYIIREIVFLARINSNRFRLERRLMLVCTLLDINIFNKLALICKREKSRVQIAFKRCTVNVYCFLFGFARQGVPNIVLVHSLNHHNGSLMLDCCRG